MAAEPTGRQRDLGTMTNQTWTESPLSPLASHSLSLPSEFLIDDTVTA